MSIGATVAAGTPVIRLISEDLPVRFTIPENRAAGLAPGQKLEVFIPYLDMRIPVALERVHPEVEVASRRVIGEAKLQFDASVRPRVLAGTSRYAVESPVARWRIGSADSPLSTRCTFKAMHYFMGLTRAASALRSSFPF